MEFTAFASGSAGNLYRLSDGTTPLLLEAGLPIKAIRQALSFRLSAIRAALISHEHMDHAKGASDVMKAGVDCYMTAGTAKAVGLSGLRLHTMDPLKQFRIGTWTVLPFPTEHDAAEPVGLLLASDTGERAVYLTDTAYCRYRFSGLSLVALEANYSQEILDENVAAGTVARELRDRIRRSHMSLETALGFLKANDLSRVREIHLLHLSSTNADPQAFRRAVMEATGVPTYIAR